MVVAVLIWIAAFVVLLLAAAHLWTRKLAADAERLVPQVGNMQRVDGGVMHFVDLGPRDAPAVVLIHGLHGQLQHFTYAMSGLLETDFRVVALDRWLLFTCGSLCKWVHIC